MTDATAPTEPSVPTALWRLHEIHRRYDGPIPDAVRAQTDLPDAAARAGRRHALERRRRAAIARAFTLDLARRRARAPAESPALIDRARAFRAWRLGLTPAPGLGDC